MTNVQFGAGATIQSPGETMTPEWAKWIATNALQGISGQDLLQTMVGAGFTEEVAVREVNAALTHPYLQAAAAMGAGANGVLAPASSTGTRGDKLAWVLDNQRRLGRMASTYGEVPRVHKPSRQEFLDEYYSQNRPVVITGAIDDWPALKLWNGDYLKEKCGDKIVEVQANRNSDSDYEKNSTKHKKQMPFAEIVDIIESGVETNDWYITANNSGQNKAQLIDLWDDIRFPDYLDGTLPNNGFFWYGPSGTVTPIHHDLTNNFMAQVRGSKRVKIISPSESALVYNDTHCFSPVDLENIDLAKFPDFANVNVIDVDIHPGDLFFLPVGWWHHVRGLELSITMTFTNFVYENDHFTDYTTYGEIS